MARLSAGYVEHQAVCRGLPTVGRGRGGFLAQRLVAGFGQELSFGDFKDSRALRSSCKTFTIGKKHEGFP